MVDLPGAFKDITGQEPTPGQVQRVLAVAHKLGISNSDPMLPILAALDAYSGLFAALPERMAAVADSAARTAAGKAQGDVEAAVKAAVATLTPTVAEAVSRTAQQVTLNTSQRTTWQWICGSVAGTAITLCAFGWVLNDQGYQDGFAAGHERGYAEARGEKAAAAWANTSIGRRAWTMDQVGHLSPLLNCTYQHLERQSVKDGTGKSRPGCVPDKDFSGWHLD
jgi:hypothetical protein